MANALYSRTCCSAASIEIGDLEVGTSAFRDQRARYAYTVFLALVRRHQRRREESVAGKGRGCVRASPRSYLCARSEDGAGERCEREVVLRRGGMAKEASS